MNALGYLPIVEEMKEREMLALADEIVERVKENEQQKARFKEIADDRIRKIEEQLEQQVSKLDNWIEQDKFTLLQIADLSKTKETKTQRKLELLAGDVVIKKSVYKLKNDNAKILESIKSTRKDLIKTKTETTLDWAGLKKELQVVGQTIIYKETGEVVDIDGLGLEEVPEIVQVK